MNKFLFTGNLGKDAEVRFTADQKAICTFSVAVKSGYGDKEKANWVNCVLFGARASGRLPGYLVKGSQVAISGELSIDEWEKDGVKNKAVKVVVDGLDLIGGRAGTTENAADRGVHQGASGSPSQQAAQPQASAPQRPEAAPQQAQGVDGFDDIDDIPF